ncbi:MAG: 50S ribosomal protein L29 [Patescibacteria group bacterium]
MKAKELKKKSKEELEKDLHEKQIALRDIRFGVAGAKAKNVKEYSNTKRQIARIKTVIRIKN